MLVLLAASLGDADADGVQDAAVLVELTHLASLYHDDVMDEADIRRGAPSANSMWDNTVAILVSGDVARDIAQRHGISPRRAASVLDIFACVPQGILPYGAQILLAAGLASVSPLALSGTVFYCWILALVTLGFIAWPRRVEASEAALAEGPWA